MITAKSVKEYARELGADLVGIGGVDRCEHAPAMMSPQGLFPGARSVIVMAIHHPDACIELGGEKHPQEIGPYSVQYLMNSRLDEMAYRLATFLEKQRHGALPIASSNIWRYNQYKSLKAVFAPDLSHIYMAVVAGLADIGYNGLALTPQYGARNRFISVITDAALEADPLIPPGTVCDRCMLCRTNCPSGALSEEIDGEKVLKIAGYEYRFPNKNLWRCAWGEHFDLDLDLEIPAKVTEQVILDAVRQHGVRSGEMGQCLKFCVPKAVRMFDKTYSRAPMRKYPTVRAAAKGDGMAAGRLLNPLLTGGADEVRVCTAEELKKAGIDLEAWLPGARAAVTVGVPVTATGGSGPFRFGAQYQVDSLCYDLTRSLECEGFRSVMTIQRSGDGAGNGNISAAIQERMRGETGQDLIANTVITRMPLAAQTRRVGNRPGTGTGDLTAEVTGLARELGADLVGVASAGRMDELATQLKPLFEGETLWKAVDRSVRFTPYQPEISPEPRAIKTASDHLPGARSVLVLGLRLHGEALRRATRPPAEAVGPYSYQTYITRWLGCVIGYRLVRRLEMAGHGAVMVTDLTGTDSRVATPRDPQPDLFSNRFAGLAAGLGQLTVSGLLVTPEFGIRQYLMAVVTDAPLEASPLPASRGEAAVCAGCSRICVNRCPSRAITGRRVEVRCEGQTYAFQWRDGKRCDWVKRYTLMGESGFRYLGSSVDILPSDRITSKSLAGALRQHDPIKKYRPAVAEPCVIHCPLSAADFERGVGSDR